jgi:exopolysaccharide biosynthesis polyprenyl glycosylphosphotransferase
MRYSKVDLFLLALLVPLDFLMIVFGGLFAHYLRFQESVLTWRPALFSIDLFSYFQALLLVAGIGVVLFALNGLYNTSRRPFYKDFAKILFATAATLMVVLLYLFFIKENFASRFIVLFAWIGSTFFVIFGRLFILFLRQYLYRNDFALKHIVVVGNDSISRQMISWLEDQQKFLGYRVVKILSNPETLFVDLYQTLDSHPNVKEVWQCDQSFSRQNSVKLIDVSMKYHLVFKYVSGSFESRVTNIDVNVINGIPLVELKRTSLEGWGRIVKRFVDILGSMFGIILFSPVMLTAAIAIKWNSKGPILADIPERAGQYGKPFRFFKFRSMYVGAHKDQAKLQSEREGLFKLEKDPRITKVGAFIRKWSIDELPQFFNVLIGNMSLVGPRPHFTYEYEEQHKRVLALKPGITGMGQVSGRSDLSFDDEVKLDLYYMEHWSIWLDLWIIIKTPFAILRNRKAS